MRRPLGDLRLARRVDALVRPERVLRDAVTTVLASLARVARQLVAVGEQPVPDDGCRSALALDA